MVKIIINNFLRCRSHLKIYFDKNQLAAEKIVKLWENLDNNKLSKP